ncbi:MAG: hypothetical protein ACRDRI_25465 [Pseudonocardiaceae bacterium]
MPTRPPRPTEDPWRDVDGTPIPLHCGVEQIAVNTEHGALPSRLHQQGHVIGQVPDWLYVRFHDDDHVIRLRAHLVRVLTTPGDNPQRVPTSTTPDDDPPWLE